jgi:hypothetical protein
VSCSNGSLNLKKQTMTDSLDPSQYRITIQGIVDEGEHFLKATVGELPDVAVFGHDYSSVVEETLEVVRRLHAVAVEKGRAFPTPLAVDDRYSGRITLRVPKSLHAQIADCAMSDGISLNTWVVGVLSEKVGEHHAATQAKDILVTAAQSSLAVTTSPSSGSSKVYTQ